MGRTGLVLLGLVLGALVLAGCALVSRLPGFGQGCPPAEWRLEPIEGERLSRLEPACAREELGKALAFYMARTSGYGLGELTERLGVVRAQAAGKVNVPWVRGAMDVTLRVPAGFTRPDFVTWGTGRRWATPVGCFGPWGDYQVACWVVVLEEAGEGYARAGTVQARWSTDPFEVWFLWGRDRAGDAWTLLGGAATQEPPALEPRRADLDTWARRFGLAVLDEDTLARVYGLPPRRPPVESAVWPAGEEAVRRLIEAVEK